MAATKPDEELFLDEIAAFLDAQEPLPLALIDSLPICSVAELLVHSSTLVASPLLLRESSAPDESGEANEKSCEPRAGLLNELRPAKARNASRERMQSELKQLRVQSQELQRQLAALNTTSPPASLQHELLLRVTWEQVAKRQLELRDRAEAENARLRVQLEARAVVLRNLDASSSLLTESGFHNDHHSTLSQLSTPFAPPTASPSLEDVELYKQLLAELDGVWLQMDDVLEENGLLKPQITSSMPPQARLKSRRSPSGGQQQVSLYIELIEAEVLPFERDPVFSVMWECWARHGASKNCILLEHKPEEVIASTTRVMTRFNGKDVSLDFIHAAKVFRDNDRVCYVWRGVTKADDHFPGVLVDEVGWQIMKPRSLGADAAGTEAGVSGTEIVTCWQLESKSRFGGGDERQEPRRVSPLANLVISTAEADTLEVNNKMLNMLLEDASHPSIDHHNGHRSAERSH